MNENKFFLFKRVLQVSVCKYLGKYKITGQYIRNSVEIYFCPNKIINFTYLKSDSLNSSLN